MAKRIPKSGTPLKPADHLEIDNLETVRVMSDPFRLQILMQMMNPSTAKSIAAALSVPVTKIYYHLNLLEQHKLIRVVNTRVVSGIIEKQYQVTAYSFGPKAGLVGPAAGINEALALFETGLENAKLEMRRAFNADLIGPPDEHSQVVTGDRTVNFTRGLYTLTEDQAAKFRKRLGKLLKETWNLCPDPSQAPEDAQLYTITLAFHRTITPFKEQVNKPSKKARKS